MDSVSSIVDGLPVASAPTLSHRDAQLERQRDELRWARVNAANPDHCEHVPTRFEGLTFADWDPKVGPFGAKVQAAMRAAIDDDADRPRPSVLLTGPVGCGKTAAAAIICNERAMPLNREYWEAEAALLELMIGQAEESPVPMAMGASDDQRRQADELRAALRMRFDPAIEAARKRTATATRRLGDSCPIWVSVPALLARLRREMGTEQKTGLRLTELAVKAPLLVLDDIGATRNTDWAIQVITEIVSERYDEERQTIVTSNVSPQELADVGLERVISRLAEDGILLAIGSAKDQRMTKRRSLG